LNRARLLLADDHTLLLQGICKLLEGDFEIAGSVENGRELLDAAVALQPDVVLLDISMPVLNGIDATRQLHTLVPSSKIVVLTMHADPEYVHEAFRAGASAYVLKQSAVSELVGAIRTVLRGDTYLTPLIKSADPRSVAHPAGREVSPRSVLTPRQREVLQLIAEGRTAKEIGSILRISAKTVEFHKSRISKNLGLRSVAEATRFAMRHGIVGQ
jgi:DNA-binding NarL/FixJ family response regulator